MILAAVAAKLMTELGLNAEEKKKSAEITGKNFPSFYKGLNVPMDVIQGKQAPVVDIVSEVLKLSGQREFLTGADQLKANTEDKDSVGWGGIQPIVNGKEEDRPEFNYSINFFVQNDIPDLRIQANDNNPNAQAIKGEIKKTLDKLNLSGENQPREQGFAYFVPCKGLQAQDVVNFVEDIMGTIPMYGDIKSASKPNVAKKIFRNPFKKQTTLPSGETANVASKPNFR
jgi:hypothetical protein